MLAWISANIANIVVVAILIIVFAVAFISLIRDRRSGRSGCGCNCGQCPMGDSCSRRDRNQQ